MLNLLFPKVCAGCKQQLLKQEDVLCTECVHSLPIASFHKTGNSVLKDKFYGRFLLQNATALAYFQKRGLTQQLLHNLKYRGRKEISSFFGKWLGAELSESYINQTLESSSSTINELNINSKYLKKKLKILNIKNKNSFHYKIPINIITLDYFIEKKKITNIDLLKIDTEGYEFNVLKGLSKHNQKIKLVYFEHHYDDMIVKDYTFGDIHQLLKSFGFVMIKKTKMLFRKSFEYVYENQKA